MSDPSTEPLHVECPRCHMKFDARMPSPAKKAVTTTVTAIVMLAAVAVFVVLPVGWLFAKVLG